MTDYELANQMTDVMGLFLDSLAVFATIIFAYVTGAFYYLHRAPTATKLASFLFFFFVMLVWFAISFGSFLHFMALVEEVGLRAVAADASSFIQSANHDRSRQLPILGLWTFAPAFVGMVAVCFWMTFCWTPEREATGR